ncbi:hypothetical protein ERO13_A08G214466v2 [Gossypium hirsutum]|uniref:Uncharacterized protein n=2 Tax=Gossypium TaxID=3633 RepID=A0A5D2YDC6_GOSMU|nr:hypothetical protein ERO13_A08G214466v2 [Gossypium hirsutum]TYI16370.1 hypothetical protein ES332_A08G250300v1 [Gossypium tomentosum]TYJ24056.1 hypothetical protein E1A91_A08G234900v1 [Gossypium mustelinum]
MEKQAKQRNLKHDANRFTLKCIVICYTVHVAAFKFTLSFLLFQFYNAQWLMERQALPINLRLDANRFTLKMSCYNANGFIWMLSSSMLHCFYFSSTMFDD